MKKDLDKKDNKIIRAALTEFIEFEKWSLQNPQFNFTPEARNDFKGLIADAESAKNKFSMPGVITLKDREQKAIQVALKHRAGLLSGSEWRKLIGKPPISYYDKTETKRTLKKIIEIMGEFLPAKNYDPSTLFTKES